MRHYNERTTMQVRHVELPQPEKYVSTRSHFMLHWRLFACLCIILPWCVKPAGGMRHPWPLPPSRLCQHPLSQTSMGILFSTDMELTAFVVMNLLPNDKPSNVFNMEQLHLKKSIVMSSWSDYPLLHRFNWNHMQYGHRNYLLHVWRELLCLLTKR